VTGTSRVAVVVVHFGDPATTHRCLDSLGGIDEVILVDQPPNRAGNHPRVTRHIEPGANLGFAAACNLAVAATEAPFVLLLNNDAVLEPGAMRALDLALAFLTPDVGGACLKLLDLDGVTLQNAGGLWFTRDGIGFPRGFGERDRGQYDGAPDHVVGVPSGAAALYRRDAWLEAGGMSDEFFCYCEDGDLGLRMIALGYRFTWLPQVRVRHEMSGASGAHSLFKAFHVERNHFATMLHTAPWPVLAGLPVATIARIARAALDAVRGRAAGAQLVRSSSPIALAVTLLGAWVGALRMIPAALAKRRALLRHKHDSVQRVGSFLAARRVHLGEFARSREPAPGIAEEK